MDQDKAEKPARPKAAQPRPTAREMRLAQALRDNLRRRKAAPPDPASSAD